MYICIFIYLYIYIFLLLFIFKFILRLLYTLSYIYLSKFNVKRDDYSQEFYSSHPPLFSSLLHLDLDISLYIFPMIASIPPSHFKQHERTDSKGGQPSSPLIKGTEGAPYFRAHLSSRSAATLTNKNLFGRRRRRFLQPG